MATEFVPNQHATEQVTAHVLWMTTGLSCEGDSVAMTAATNPSLEDIILGIIPGMPRVVIHNQVIAYEVGQEYIQAWYDAEQGKLDPFVLIIEGSIGNEEINGDGHWSGFGVNPETDQPITTNEWVDRPRQQGRGRRRDRHLRHVRRHPRHEEQPDRRDGPARLPRLELEVEGRPAGRLHPGLPGAAGQHDRDAAVPVLHLGGLRAGAELDDQLRPKWLFGRTVRRELQPRRLLRAGHFATEYGSTTLPGQARLQGPVVKCNVPLRGWVNGIGGCPNVGGICMACTMPGFPDKYMPFMDRTHGAISAERARFTYGPVLRGSGTATSSASTTRSPSGAQPRRAHHRLPEALVEGERHGDVETPRAEGRRQGDVVGPDHPHRRVAGHPHRDRLHEPAGHQVLLDVDGLPRVRHLHEGDRPARRALHHQPHLRHLR
jgi:hydrogenase small subunit